MTDTGQNHGKNNKNKNNNIWKSAGRLIAFFMAFALIVTGSAVPADAAESRDNNDNYINNTAEGRTAREMADLWFGGGAILRDLQDADINNNINNILGEYFTLRESEYLDGAARLESVDMPVSGAVLNENADRENLIETMQDRLNINITDAVVKIDPDSVQMIESGENNNLILYCYEWTFFDYDDLRDGEGGQDVTGYGSWHKITLAPDENNNNYIILSDEYDESDILGLSTMQDDTRLDMQAAGYLPEYDNPDDFPEILNNNNINNNLDNPDAELQGIRYSTEYNVRDAIAYSETYVWHGASGGKSYPEYYNLPEYENFNPIGGDCANFTSQAIKAGHMPEVISSNGWYYNSQTRSRSVSWASSTNHRRWFSNNRGNLVEKLTAATESNIFPGSPVYYSTKQAGIYTHTVLCVGRNSAGRPIINSHNNDRWHAIWNYYSSTATIDTVQLTSDNFFGSFQGYANPGDDFYAKIYNPNYTRYAGADSNGNVIAESWRDWRDGGDQIWRFERLDDGSYKISSALTQNCMAVSGGGYLSRTPIVTESYDGSSGQQWYLYPKSGGYLFRASCTDRVLDYPNGREYEDGTPFWIFGRNDINGRTGIEAQVFLLELIDESEIPRNPGEAVIDPSGLRVEFENLNAVTFSWDSVPNAAGYTIKITQNGEEIQNSSNLTNTSVSFELNPGDYSAVVTAYHRFGYALKIRSADFTVSAPAPKTFKISYDANGGSGAPSSQTKNQNETLTLSYRVPDRTGFRFMGWNTEKDGSGKSYWPRSTFNLNADATLYAQWETQTYTVTLHANGGAFADSQSETKTIQAYYGGTYGELPEPVREGFQFLGWYADAQGGAEQITTGMSVITSEDHDLYARWELNNQPGQIAVTLDANGGSVSVNGGRTSAASGVIRVRFGESYGANLTNGVLPDATRDGFIFLGWFTELRAGKEITADTTVENQEPHKLYAHWQSERRSITVTFRSFDNSDSGEPGATPTPITKSVYYGEPYGELPEPESHPEGREFLGWFTEPDGGAQILPESTVNQSEAHTLYAHWEATPDDTPTLNIFVYRAESDYLIRASFTDIPQDAILIAAGYRDGRLIAAVTQTAGENNAAELRLPVAPDFYPDPDSDTPEPSLDKIKIFAVDKSGNPVCGATETPSSAFGRA